jgi:phosphomannomutase
MSLTLRESLAYAPQALRFGTSGRRGEVVHLTQLEVYLNALAELEYLQTLPRARGGIVAGEAFFFAYDRRLSSSQFVAEQGGRGELAQAIAQAIADAGMRPVNCGQLPTPALTYYALQKHRGSMMITGSHIPFARNGYKTNSSVGELLKDDEAVIAQHVAAVRVRLYQQPADASPFDATGTFRDGHHPLPPEHPEARAAYLRRYLDFFPAGTLAGLRLLAYEHSAVGRDLLVELLRALGAEVIPVGRSETFVPIDTENVDDALLAAMHGFVGDAQDHFGPFDAVVSTDGDSDRPLILGVVPHTDQVRFFGGDLVGMLVAEYLEADAVVVPISCNDAIDRSSLQEVLEPKTRIGSPYVIAGMLAARARGKARICGWEANGGFLLGSDVTRDGRALAALPTRDALLPILCVLAAANERQTSLVDFFARLPARFSKAALLKEFPRTTSARIVARLSLAHSAVTEIRFAADAVTLFDAGGHALPLTPATQQEAQALRALLKRIFIPELGFAPISSLNYIDGIRIGFQNADVAHVRPSGNADELRIYAVADTQARADEIARLGVAEPDGLLRRLARVVHEQEAR